MEQKRVIEGIETVGLLPLGSIVKIKGSNKKIMIIGNLVTCKKPKEDKIKLFDYVGCFYPEGISQMEMNIYFYDDEVEEIFSFGYCHDEKYLRFIVMKNIFSFKKINLA